MDKPDKPSDDEVKEVFAAYGLAMYQSQCLERQMALHLVMSRAPKETHYHALEEELAQYFGATFGQVADQFVSAGGQRLVSESLAGLTDLRNELAHSYFWNRAADFVTGAGCQQMAAALFVAAGRFKSADAELTPHTLKLYSERGVTTADWAELMDEVAREGPGDVEALPKRVRLVALLDWKKPGMTGPGVVSLFVMDDGRRVLLGHRGLCLGPQGELEGTLIERPVPAAALPADVNPRPRDAQDWSYRIALSGGYELWVSPEREAGCSFKFGFRRRRAGAERASPSGS